MFFFGVYQSHTSCLLLTRFELDCNTKENEDMKQWLGGD